MRQDRRRLPAQQYLAPQLARHFRGEDRPQPRPYLPLLEAEVLPARPGEPAEQFLESGVGGVKLVQLVQEFPDLELLAEGPVGERSAAGDTLPASPGAQQ